MNTRTPPAPVQASPAQSGSLPQIDQGSAGLDDDLRKFTTLTPLQQLERLQADERRVKERERAMREAERQVNGKGEQT